MHGLAIALLAALLQCSVSLPLSDDGEFLRQKRNAGEEVDGEAEASVNGGLSLADLTSGLQAGISGGSKGSARPQMQMQNYFQAGSRPSYQGDSQLKGELGGKTSSGMQGNFKIGSSRPQGTLQASGSSGSKPTQAPLQTNGSVGSKPSIQGAFQASGTSGYKPTTQGSLQVSSSSGSKPSTQGALKVSGTSGYKPSSQGSLLVSSSSGSKPSTIQGALKASGTSGYQQSTQGSFRTSSSAGSKPLNQGSLQVDAETSINRPSPQTVSLQTAGSGSDKASAGGDLDLGGSLNFGI